MNAGPLALILLVEDRDDDILLILKAFGRAKIPNPIQVVKDGDEAIAYLQGVGKFSNREEYPLPSLILLDLKLPRVDGFEVLEWVRKQSGIQGIRIVVLTSSKELRDVNKAYAAGANSFLVKPGDFQHFVDLGGFVNDYWLRMDRSPELKRPDEVESPLENLESGMRVFLRDPLTRKYYVGNQEWSGDRVVAMNLESVERAEALSIAENLRGAEIVLSYSQPRCEIRLPLTLPGIELT